MNIALNPNQSNTRKGDITLLGSVDLTGKENYLLKIVNSSGKAKFALPTDTADLAPYICASGDVAGNESAAEAPSVNENCRIKLKGTCVPGDQLVLADPGTAADAGKVRKLPSATGTYYVRYLAEESGVDGQDVLCRPIGERKIVVS